MVQRRRVVTDQSLIGRLHGLILALIAHVSKVSLVKTLNPTGGYRLAPALTAEPLPSVSKWNYDCKAPRAFEEGRNDLQVYAILVRKLISIT